MKNIVEKVINWFKTTNFKNLVKKEAKDPIFWVRFSAYAIPLAFLLYVLYVNFLPFGYSQTFVINVGGPNDTKVSEFYLEPSPNLSDRKVAPDGAPYRELNGSAFAVFKPNAILKNADVKVSVEGDGVSLIIPIINFDPSTIKWDYSWDFSSSTPTDLKGNAFHFDDGEYFNGKDARLELPNSADKFESVPFTVYAEWMPKDGQDNLQEIVGHFNWGLWQNKDSVLFQVGRMNNAQGLFYSIKYPTTPDFFNQKHTAIAIYNPSDSGYIDLYVDGNLAGRSYFNSDKIWSGYGTDNLSFGWEQNWNYGKAPHFMGSIYKISYISKNILSSQSEINFVIENNDPIDISVFSTATSTLKQIKLYVVQE